MLVLDPELWRLATTAFRDDAVAAAELRQRAQAALTAGPWSVMDKEAVPPSGDKHDFMSLGTYWWPDPAKPDGRPYVRRDGEPNPELLRLDRPRLSAMSDTVMLLATAAAFGCGREHAQRAGLLLRTWFIAPATRMNPHLRFGQGIPGVCDGRCIGIIDSECLARVCDAIVLLRRIDGLDAGLDAGVTAWLDAYLDWLLTDPLGVAEAEEGNNHGTCYDVQIVALARHCRRPAIAERTLAAVPARRLASQLAPDGRMPRELARTKAWSYSLKNLMALLNLAAWGAECGCDLWGWRDGDGRSMAAAVRWLAPFALGERPWAHQELGGFAGDALAGPLLRAALLDPGGPYAADLVRLGADPGRTALAIASGVPAGALGALGRGRGFHG